MIIVEGPDGAGKTRLVQKLEQYFGVEHQPRPVTSKDGPVVDLVEWVEKDLSSQTLAMNSGIPGTYEWLRVYDRYPLISEPIYGPLIRGSLPKGWTWEWQTKMMGHLKNLGVVVLFCLPPLDVVKTNIAKDLAGQMAGVYANAETIYSLYEVTIAHWARGHACHFFGVLDYTQEDHDFTLALNFDDIQGLRDSFHQVVLRPHEQPGGLN